MLHMPTFEVGQVCIGGLRAALERAQGTHPTRARFARTTGVGGFQADIGGGAEYPRPEQVVTSTTSRSLAGHQVELETSAKLSATCRITAAQAETDLLPFGKGESSRAG